MVDFKYTLLYLLVIILWTAAWCFGHQDGNGVFDYLYRFLNVYPVQAVKKVLQKCFGPRGPAALDSIWNYIFCSRNPLAQICYVCLVCGCYATFLAFARDHIPNQYAPWWHQALLFLAINLSVLIWATVCRADPGTVTKENVDEICVLWEWDEQLFTDSDCRTCGFVKPARSKHCALCDICVARFDHHCIWVNSCIGIGNQRWFLLFLAWHAMLCFYCLALVATSVVDIIVTKQLYHVIFVDPRSGERFQATHKIVGQYLLATEGLLLFIGVTCVCMGPVLCGFLGWHLNLIRLGCTTNEHMKWGTLRSCLKREGPEGVERINELRNIYNKGFWSNLGEVVFPVDVHNMPAASGKDATATANGKEKRSKGTRKAAAAKPSSGDADNSCAPDDAKDDATAVTAEAATEPAKKKAQ